MAARSALAEAVGPARFRVFFEVLQTVCVEGDGGGEERS